MSGGWRVISLRMISAPSASAASDREPPRVLHERERPALEVDQQVRARRAAGDERGQERADAGGLGEPQALEDVEQQLHAGRIPCGRDDCRGQGRGAPRRNRRMDARPAGSAARDLERYAALFASRTRVMTSSAMRDLMAITERPEVISLAGGLPDTSTFPPEMHGRRHGARRRGLARRARCSTARPRACSPRARASPA